MSQVKSLWTLISCAVGATALAAVVAAPGCSAERCNSSNPNVPLPALECPAGDLCYRGSCVRGCNANRERRESCRAEGDTCGGARPFCRAGLCTACEEGDLCVAGLNVCAPATTVEIPPEPMKPGETPRPKFPLDAGDVDGEVIDPGIIGVRDAGQEEIGRTEISFVTLIDLATEKNYLNNGVETSISAVQSVALPVGSRALPWSLQVSPPAVVCDAAPPEPMTLEDLDGCGQRLAEEGLGVNCTIIPLRRPAGVVLANADIGPISILDAKEDNGITREAITPDLTAEFIGGDYLTYTTGDGTKTPSVGQLVHSTFTNFESDRDRRVLVAGDGLQGAINGSWPEDEAGLDGAHVPIFLAIDAPTQLLLESGAVFDTANLTDFVYKWDQLQTGMFPGEQVVVRITGTHHLFECGTSEGVEGARTDLIIQAGALQRFLQLEKDLGVVIGPNATFRLVLERTGGLGIQVPTGGLYPDGTSILARVDARVRSTLVSRLVVSSGF